ncbi:hypothetical protein GPECTOR_16g712 [Gonium pectorale]|uniref:tRNA (guanine(46)-N(7))-methyltransferase n=1 Tax=Gonium pectorale TaxID=33097 RepID=A0A150GL73_GONPE|nr:hypothetical protein GPECTOR_16g712 [Gonium pectorale]|eukprot:KXZ50537.1 hypothetical protein GPECTOR_16g712 [Gonium pectorale]
MELWDGTGKTRVRQHVNPLRRDFQTPPPPPDWTSVYSDPTLPLALDIGSGYGRFLLLLQRNNPERRVNYLGIEIRRAVRRPWWSQDVHYVFANATVSVATLLAGYPGPLTDVFIQFPDPHFKRRHHKRRVVQPQLVAALRALMPSGGRLLLQSDVEEVTVAMRNTFELYGGDAFELAPQHAEGPVFHSRPTAPAASACCGGGEAASSSGAFAASTGLGGGQGAGAGAAAGTQLHHLSDGGGWAADGAGAGSSTESDAGADSEGDGESANDDEDGDIANMVSQWAAGGWLMNNPIGTPTEREHYVGQQGLPVYRVLLVRK